MFVNISLSLSVSLCLSHSLPPSPSLSLSPSHLPSSLSLSVSLSLSFKQADPGQLSSFLKIVRMVADGREIPERILSHLVPAATVQVTRPVEILRIECPSKYPMIFPKTLHTLSVSILCCKYTLYVVLRYPSFQEKLCNGLKRVSLTFYFITELIYGMGIMFLFFINSFIFF